MKVLGLLGSLLVSAGMYLLGAHLGGYEIVPIYDTVFVTVIFMAIIAHVVSLVGVLVYLIAGIGIAMIPTMIGALAGGSKETLQDGLLLFAAPVIFIGLFFVHPAIMTTWVPNKFDWFVQFTYWQYFGLSIVTTMLVLTVGQSTKKK